METKLEVVYEAFLQKITDYNFANNMTDEDVEEKLRGLLKTACRNFRKCKKNLSFDEANIIFVSELDGMEIEILAYLMVVEYLTAKVVSTESLEQVLNDKDFKIYSQANQLSNVEQVRKNFRSMTNKLITEYLYEEKVSKNDKR